MDKRYDLSVILPTYNEVENLPIIIHRIEEMDLNCQIVVVDDNSKDKTADAADRLNEKYGNIVVVRRPGKNGIATAVRDGLLNSQSKYVIVMDSDLQHPPEVIPRILRQLENGKDLVIASRYVRGGSAEFNVLRKTISKMATFLAHMNIQKTDNIKDPMSGFFGFRRDKVLPESIVSNGYKILLELLVATDFRNIGEVPYRFIKRKRGKSKLGMGEFLKYIKLVLRLSDYQMIKFMAVGLTGALLNLLIMNLSFGYFKQPLIFAGLLALEGSIVSNFLLNNYWTYRKRLAKSTVFRRYLKYNFMSSLGLGINISILLLLTHFGMNYMLADFIGIIGSFTTNFGGSQGVVWHL